MLYVEYSQMDDNRMSDYVGEYASLMAGQLEEGATVAQVIEAVMHALASMADDTIRPAH